MKHVRAMRVSLSQLPSLVFKYAYTLRLHCGVCHVNVKPKFTEEQRSLKLHTLVERRGKLSTTDEDICIKIDLAHGSEG